MDTKFLEKIINKEVALTDLMGRTYKGRLSELEGGAVKIVVDSRNMVYYIPYDCIASISVKE